MTNEVFTDKRLLGALDYIDERFIAEVTESYTFEAPGEYKRDKKTVFRAYRQFAALAACLLLISAAFPVLNYAVQRFGTGIWEGNAGAGESSDVELNEYGSPYERAIDAYPADMPAEEIYADVLKGGWVVGNITNFGAEIGIELWIDFYNNVTSGKEARILIAEYWDSNPYFDALDISYNKELNGIKLLEIVFDGQQYTVNCKYSLPEGFFFQSVSLETTDSFTYRYLICDDKYCDEGVCFILSDDATMTMEKWRSLPGFEDGRLTGLDAFRVINLKWQDYNVADK